MDKILVDRQVLEQALEALENSSPDQYPEDAGVFYNARDALRAVLEQPEEGRDWKSLYDAQVKLTETAMQRADRAQRLNLLGQSGQEPAARVLQTVGQYHTGRFVAEVETVRRLHNGEELYTHPPRREWQGLTEGEILEVADAHPIEGFDSEIITFVLDIETALKEKNHG